MKNKIFNYEKLWFLLALAFLLVIFSWYQKEPKRRLTNNYKKDIPLIELAKLSRLLNDASKKIGQQSCELTQQNVTENGGWCEKIGGRNSTTYYFDETLAREIGRILAGKRVANFGDGPGAYRDYILNMKTVKAYDAFDGAPYIEISTDDRVSFLDMSIPIYHLERYDWVVSLEVGEHIPPEYESIYLDNLARHAKEGIILSWAKVGQVGPSHVNCRDFEYVKEQVESRGFYHDSVMSSRLSRKAFAHWLRSNINVYLRHAN